MELRKKKILFITLILILFLPLIQMKTHFLSIETLNGVYELSEKPDSLSKRWFSEAYQIEYDSYFNDHLGFRPFFVRVFNQKNFSFFKKAPKGTAVLGTNNIPFDGRYIKTIFGYDFIGEKEIKKTLDKLIKVSNDLEKKDKHLLVVFAPNKARYYRSAIPDEYSKKDTNNYSVYKTLLNEYDINTIDFNSFFLKEKAKYDFELIPKYGIHWSNYGAYIAADSIINYCNKNFSYHLPTYKFDSIYYTNKPTSADFDLGSVLNVFMGLGNEKYAYPFPSIVNEGKRKRKLLVISDSFYGTLHDLGFSKDIFELTGFWYYNRENSGSNIKLENIDFKQKLQETDLVILMQTEWNLYRLGFGFIEQYISEIEGARSNYNHKQMMQIKRIKSNKKWLEKVEIQAEKRNISLDSMLIRAANYVIKNQKK